MYIYSYIFKERECFKDGQEKNNRRGPIATRNIFVELDSVGLTARGVATFTLFCLIKKSGVRLSCFCDFDMFS